METSPHVGNIRGALHTSASFMKWLSEHGADIGAVLRK
jgi:hypothetical protein